MSRSKQLEIWLNQQVGLDYLWGGKTGKGGYDCSGLVREAFSNVGIELPDGSFNQAVWGRAIDVRVAHEGCLVFKRHPITQRVNHVAVVVSGPTDERLCVIEAKGKKYGVVKARYLPMEWAMARKIDELYKEGGT